jgi:hypothetical protein
MTHAQIGELTANAARPNSVAPLKNVASCLALCEALLAAPPRLPNIGVFSGFSGYGKSIASQYAWNRLGAVYVEVRDFWSRKMFVSALLSELGQHRPRGTIGDMMLEAIGILGDMPAKLIIIDEADKLVDKKMIELARDLNEAADVPILLVGEENLPAKLQAFERVDNRVLDFVLAQPCDLDDARALRRFLYPKLGMTDELLDRIRASTGGKARRIATTLHEADQFARQAGVGELTIENYKGRIFTGEAPKRHERRAA